MNIGDWVGVQLGVKLVNGKIKPKYCLKSILLMVIQLLFFVGFFFAFVYGCLNFNIEFIVMPAIGMFSFGYLLLVNPYIQKPNNYYIEFESDSSLVGFKLFYKGKLVSIQYKIDEKGKIAFANNNSKLSCIAYADNSKMSTLTKYKIINYFTKWLSDNGLLSPEVTVTFEEL